MNQRMDGYNAPSAEILGLLKPPYQQPTGDIHFFAREMKEDRHVGGIRQLRLHS